MYTINAAVKLELYITDVDCRKDLELGFSMKMRHIAIRGDVGALDGRLLWQKTIKAVHNPKRYLCARKEKLSTVLISIGDSQR